MEPTAGHSATTAKRPSPPQPPVRLSLAPHKAVPGGFDGAWWPYSHNLADELPVVVQAMDGVGSITRVIPGIERWPDIPHRVAVGGQFVSAGWFASGHEQNVVEGEPVDDGRAEPGIREGLAVQRFTAEPWTQSSP
ncbi:DUF5994 family protein [Streptomyces sp. RLB1-33]|uniref:DUF5994 family protein n=1 Tax=Streptomyces mirabilis TaxID=68239 RepID=UPI00143E4A6C|nr:DUF5994 family protein [Streptomyces sp. RLB1-33]QIY72486.1 hypothetical protein HEP84_28455 [Streptomyces sp. RLB1-33]